MTILRGGNPQIPWDSFTASSCVPQGPTDELVIWIGKLNQKIRTVRSSRAFLDLRKETLLASAKAAAQAALRARQEDRRQRWQAICNNWDMTKDDDVSGGEAGEEEDAEAEEAGSLCDCSCCTLCQRHQSRMFGKCYCHVIFSPIPVFMDYSLTPATDLFVNVDESRDVDNFLASLGSGSGVKRKADDKLEDELENGKRCKA